MNRSESLTRTSPEEQGVSSSAVLSFANAVNTPDHEVHSFMLLRHGVVVAEGWWAPYKAEVPHMLFSLSKSFTSTAAGIAIEEGYFSLDDPVTKFFPEDLPEVLSSNLGAMRVRHLLSMSTGQTSDTLPALFSSKGVCWAKSFFTVPVEHTPGTHFLYNSGATYMVSAIVQKTTGEKVVDYLQPRLFDPLGIQAPHWDACPDGINTGGWGLSLTTEDIAKFGQLYLQKGRWDGRQLVPESWVHEATCRQVSNGDDPENDWAQGYGFQFWRCRHNAYRGDGAFGQYCVVMPYQDAVLAVTGGCNNMAEVLNLAWLYLLPAMQQSALPTDEKAHLELREALEHFAYPCPPGEVASAGAGANSGLVYRLSPNEIGLESLTFSFAVNDSEFVLEGRTGRQTVQCGYGKWVFSQTSLAVRPIGESGVLENNRTLLNTIAAACAWTAADTFVVKVRYIETPFACTYTFHFDDRRVSVSSEMNVSFGPTEGVKLEGYAG
jgi:CubicO group peptidase (beta-lactamase class C family)